MIVGLIGVCIIIIIILIFLYVIGKYKATFFKKILYYLKNINNSDSNGNPLASLNSAQYNKLYNMNYYKNQEYRTFDISKLKKTEGYVLHDPVTFDVYINFNKITLYKVDILYKIENMFYNNDEYLIVFTNDFINDSINDSINSGSINNSYDILTKKIIKNIYSDDNYDEDNMLNKCNRFDNNMYTENYTSHNKYIFIKSTIITSRNIERGDYMNVYYETDDKDTNRIAPPFLDERYIYYV